MIKVKKQTCLCMIALLFGGIIWPSFTEISVHAAGTIVYVTESGEGAKDGTSWSNALPGDQLQNAIDGASAGTQIWIAAGTYVPTGNREGNDPRSVHFQMKNNVAIYGGFPTNAADGDGMEVRDWKRHETILSGDIGTKGYKNDNAYHVFYHPPGLELDNSAILDGVTVTGGYAKGSSDFFTPHDYGGGMHNDGNSPTVINVRFIGNEADSTGGGVYNKNSNPMMTNVAIAGNSANSGGGITNTGSSPSLTNVLIVGNKASIFEGGGMYNVNSSPVLTNVTISGNWASQGSGGGMHNNGGRPIIRNSIIWGNSNEMINNNSNPEISYSRIQGGGGADPRFRAPEPAYNAPTSKGDYLLTEGSPAIDQGNNDYIIPLGVVTDLNGRMRIVNGTVDMGAYEFQPYLTLVPNRTTIGNAPVTIAVILDEDSNVVLLKWAPGERMIDDFADDNVGTEFDLTESSFTVAENGTYTVYALDENGYAVVEKIVISVIVKNKPTIELFPATEQQEGEPIEIAIVVTAEGEGNDIEELRVAAGELKEEDFIVHRKGAILSARLFTAFANGTYTVYARDRLGNVAVKTIDINSIIDLPSSKSAAPPIITVNPGVPFATIIYDPAQLYAKDFVHLDPEALSWNITGKRVDDEGNESSEGRFTQLNGTISGPVNMKMVELQLTDDGLSLYVWIKEKPAADGEFNVSF